MTSDASSSRTCLPLAVWFLYSERDQPLSQVYRREEDAVPSVGARIDNGTNGKSLDAIEFGELRTM